jgi:predicted metal-dependent phosphoesterase TrpH
MKKETPGYKLEMHLHTGETSRCGRISGSKVAELYKAAGYEGIVVTDHYHRGYFEKKFTSRRLQEMTWAEKIEQFLSGYRGALETGKLLGLTVLLGMEIRFDESKNDYLVYGLDETFLRDCAQLYSLGLQNFRRLLQEKLGDGNFLIYQAHPFRPGSSPANPADLDGVEVYNGNPRHNSRNHSALRFAEKNRLRRISGSDFHRRVDLARGGMIFPEKVTTNRQLLQLLQEQQQLELIRTAGAPLSFLRLLTGIADRFK